MYRISISPKAKKQLKSLKKIHKDAVGSVFEELKEDPKTGKPLTRELSRKYSYKVGTFRIIYTIKDIDKIVQILSIGHRSTVYQ